MLIQTGFAADKLIPIETKPIEKEPIVDVKAGELELKSMLEELPVKQREIKTKVYSGTMDEIITARINDCNDVIIHSEEIKSKAVQLAEAEGLELNKQEAVFRVVDKFRKVDNEKKMRENNEFLKAAHTIVNDPNVMPQDPNDPNYLGEVELLNQFMAAVMELTRPI